MHLNSEFAKWGKVSQQTSHRYQNDWRINGTLLLISTILRIHPWRKHCLSVPDVCSRLQVFAV